MKRNEIGTTARLC